MVRLRHLLFLLATTILVFLWNWFSTNINESQVYLPLLVPWRSTQKLRRELKVTYKDLSVCPPRPQYLRQHKAHCWRTGVETNSSQPTRLGNVTDRAKIICFPNLHVAGIRKAGTTDIDSWLNLPLTTTRLLHKDYAVSGDMCPLQFFTSNSLLWQSLSASQQLVNVGPGNLVLNKVVSYNSTHLVVVTAIQYISYMGTQDTRIYIQLRNPTDRAVSYLFHWHREKMIFTNMTLAEMDEQFVDEVFKEQMYRLDNCIFEKGERACIYSIKNGDGQMHALLAHSLYIIYVEEMFQFIPREQVLFGKMEDYAQDTIEQLRMMLNKHFKISFAGEHNHKVRNVGRKNILWRSTLEMLDEFFRRYNQRLAVLLGDESWQFLVNRQIL